MDITITITVNSDEIRALGKTGMLPGSTPSETRHAARVVMRVVSEFEAVAGDQALSAMLGEASA